MKKLIGFMFLLCFVGSVQAGMELGTYIDPVNPTFPGSLTVLGDTLLNRLYVGTSKANASFTVTPTGVVVSSGMMTIGGELVTNALIRFNQGMLTAGANILYNASSQVTIGRTGGTSDMFYNDSAGNRHMTYVAVPCITKISSGTVDIAVFTSTGTENIVPEADPRRTIAQLKLITPTGTGQRYYCIDNGSVYISTGLTPYGFIKISGGATD